MKRFAFSLQRMLGFKQTLYEKERNTLAQLRAERLALEMRRDATQAQMVRMDEDFRQKAATDGVRMDEVRKLSFHRDNAGKLIRQFDDELARMDIEIEKQLQVVIALDKEVKSLEKLRESQWEEYQREAAKEENDRILEIVTSRFAESQKAEQAEEARAMAEARAQAQ